MPDDTAAHADNPFVSYVARLRAGNARFALADGTYYVGTTNHALVSCP